MSFHVALQSVAFYVLSCSSCAKNKHRRRAKAQARRERAHKEMLQAQTPDAYWHPEPFDTNPYWNEDILMGPELAKKASSRKAASRQSSVASRDTQSKEQERSPHEQARDGAGSLVDIPEEPGTSGEKWNWRRYQREDEALWGRDMFAPGQKLLERLSKAGTAARARMEQTLGYALAKDDGSDSQSVASYYLPRNPPVNDLHPPVVSSTPASMDEVSWMLQPPPPARFMEGKERPTPQRSRDGSMCTENRRQVPLTLSNRHTLDRALRSLARANTDSCLTMRGVTLSTPKSAFTAESLNDHGRTSSNSSDHVQDPAPHVISKNTQSLSTGQAENSEQASMHQAIRRTRWLGEDHKIMKKCAIDHVKPSTEHRSIAQVTKHASDRGRSPQRRRRLSA